MKFLPLDKPFQISSLGPKKRIIALPLRVSSLLDMLTEAASTFANKKSGTRTVTATNFIFAEENAGDILI